MYSLVNVLDPTAVSMLQGEGSDIAKSFHVFFSKEQITKQPTNNEVPRDDKGRKKKRKPKKKHERTRK